MNAEREWPEPRTLTHAEFLAEATERFGEDALNFAFQCPSCGDVASIRDFPSDRRGRAGQECIGRSLGALEASESYEGRGCGWAAYGLISGPWTVDMGEGVTIPSFPFAEVAA
jgi:predicted RNA-binding Zn-ribbon protein involved in translation (DUF1610 family)